MNDRRIVIAGTGSGVGKTTITIGLMAAYQRKGIAVQGFKCGPDYIDPSYHHAVTGRSSRNLDSWMFSHATLREIFNRGSEGADLSIIEGVMGFFDGKDPTNNAGSTAEISVITRSPVVLVVNCASMARSAAAVVKGFQCFASEPDIVGVIANNVGSAGHYKLVQAAIEQECGIPVLGYVQRDEQIQIPERHLGLIPSIERHELDPFFKKLGNMIAQTVDLDRLYELALAPKLENPARSIFPKPTKPIVRIAVAKDGAFNFYYPENLELLEAYGAELVFFSPLTGECLPKNVHGLYIGGGFPEEFADTLSSHDAVKRSIRSAVQRGVPTLAECGGFMYLTEAIVTTEGDKFEMLGIIPGYVKMQKKLAALGYREVTGQSGNFLLPQGMQAKGHEFHYSSYVAGHSGQPYAYQTKGMRGSKQEGYLTTNLVAGYTHLHFASNPGLVHNWINQCKEYKDNG